jgi:hypothetical protein
MHTDRQAFRTNKNTPEKRERERERERKIFIKKIVDFSALYIFHFQPPRIKKGKTLLHRHQYRNFFPCPLSKTKKINKIHTLSSFTLM